MLEGESWHNSRLMVARALGRSLEADTEIDGLSRLLDEIGRAHVRTPVTNAHLVCRLLLEKKTLCNIICLHTQLSIAFNKYTFLTVLFIYILLIQQLYQTSHTS